MFKRNHNWLGVGMPETGLTLVEVAVAMLLLIMGLTAFIVSFVQSKRLVAVAENRMEAIHQARDKMEFLCSSLYSSTSLSIGTHNFSNGFYTVNNNASAQVKDVAVTVKWINPLGTVTSTVLLVSSISSNLHQ